MGEYFNNEFVKSNIPNKVIICECKQILIVDDEYFNI